MFGKTVRITLPALIILSFARAASAESEIFVSDNFLAYLDTGNEVAEWSRFEPFIEADHASQIERLRSFTSSQDYWLRFRSDCHHKRYGVFLADQIVEFDGLIEQGDADRLVEAVEENTEEGGCAPPILINSLGGDFDEAVRIAEYVAEQELPVIVAPGGFCVSACVYVLLASIVETDGSIKRRALTFSNSTIAVHEPYLRLDNPASARATMIAAASNPVGFFEDVGARWQELFELLVRLDASEIMTGALLSIEGQSPTTAYVLSQLELEFLGIDTIPLTVPSELPSLFESLRQICIRSMNEPGIRFNRYVREGFFQNYYSLVNTFFDKACIIKVSQEKLEILTNNSHASNGYSLLSENSAISQFSAFFEPEKHSLEEEQLACVTEYFRAGNTIATTISKLGDTLKNPPEPVSELVFGTHSQLSIGPDGLINPEEETQKIVTDLESRGLTALSEIHIERYQRNLFDRYASMASGNYPFEKLWSPFPADQSLFGDYLSCQAGQLCFDTSVSKSLEIADEDELYVYEDYTVGDDGDEKEVIVFDREGRETDILALVGFIEGLLHLRQAGCIEVEFDTYIPPFEIPHSRLQDFVVPLSFGETCPNGRGYCSPKYLAFSDGQVSLVER